MRTAAETFGLGADSDTLAAEMTADPSVMGPGRGPTYATTESRLEPPVGAVHALLDPHSSAIFWIAAAALLGLLMVTGQFKVQAAIGGRAGRR